MQWYGIIIKNKGIKEFGLAVTRGQTGGNSMFENFKTFETDFAGRAGG